MARMKHCYDQSPLSCDPINSGPKGDSLSSPGLQQAVTSNFPLSGTPVRASKPSGYLEDCWKITYSGPIPHSLRLILYLLGDVKIPVSITDLRIFHWYLGRTECFCLHAHMLLPIWEKYCFLRWLRVEAAALCRYPKRALWQKQQIFMRALCRSSSLSQLW